jgi:1,4-dihydroxy-2-naphthoyl-CoA synthase
MTAFAINFDTSSLAKAQFAFADGVATLTLHKPDLRNAISTVMLAELIYLLECCEGDDSVRVCCFTRRWQWLLPRRQFAGYGSAAG